MNQQPAYKGTTGLFPPHLGVRKPNRFEIAKVTLCFKKNSSNIRIDKAAAEGF